MSENGAPSLHDLDAFASHKYGTGKNYSIVRSSSAIISVAASALLIWILLRSRNGIKTTYHRLLLGLSVSDILLSLSMATFGAVVPSELSYIVWNAQGSQASCDTFGFLYALGSYSGLLYMSSLNLYYLAKVKFNKTDTYVAKKLEVWLHAVPTLFGLTFSIILVSKGGMNATINGLCTVSNIYDPPHCNGYKAGDILEGFKIPCGRGQNASLFFYVTGFITMFLAPIIIGSSLWVIYRTVAQAEQVIAQYGAGALQPNSSQPTGNDTAMTGNNTATTDAEVVNNGGRGAFSILSIFKCRFRRMASRTNSNNRDSSQSHTVLHRAAAYSVAYCLTWMWTIIWVFFNSAGASLNKFPLPTWVIAYLYVWNFFTPLQGLWNFLIYMQPDVIRRRRSSDGTISWFKAFADALWSAVKGGNDRRGRVALPRGPLRRPAPRERAPSPSPRVRGGSGRSEANEDRGPALALDPSASGPSGSRVQEEAFAALRAMNANIPALALDPSAPGSDRSRVQEETLAALRAMSANIVRLTTALEAQERRPSPRAARSAPLAASGPVGEEEKAEIEPYWQDGGHDEEAVAPGTSATPPPAVVPASEGTAESSLSSYHSAREYFSTRETTLSSYFSTRETTLSSYFSTSETETRSDLDDK